MSRVVRMLLAAMLAVAGISILATPASAGIWTEIPSGTAAEITAIEYQSDTRFWFTTSSGEIWKRKADLSGFDRVRDPNSIRLNDIEFQVGGDVGFAVGNGGVVLRSANAGASWTPIAGITVSNLGDGSGNKCTINTALGDVNFVRFAGNGRVWIGAEDRQIATSQTNNPLTVGNAGLWKDANKKPVPEAGNNCYITQSGGFADMFVTPNIDAFYIGTGSFDQVIFSSNNLTSTPQTKPAEVANGFTLLGTLAGDPANPSRIWAVSASVYGNSTLQYTEDGYQTSHWWNIVNDSSHPVPDYAGYDVDYAEGTVLSAGNAGYILHSVNGRDFFWNGADGALATQDWRSVSLAGATRGAVGGTNGKLVITTQANATPDIVKPTGSIAGPSTVTAGQAASFTLNAADEGGSGLNPASIRWTAPGLTAQTGNPVSLVFPNQGSATITVTFADNAGNTATATKFVTIAGTPLTGPTVVPTFVLTGPGNTSTAVIIGSRIRVRMKGAIRLPAGSDPAVACTGKVRLKLKKGKRTMLNRTVRVKFRNNRCRFKKTAYLSRAKVGRTRTIRLKIRFMGNTVLKAGSVSKTLTIRK